MICLGGCIKSDEDFSCGRCKLEPVLVFESSIGNKAVRVGENKNSSERSLDPRIMVAMASSMGAILAVGGAGAGILESAGQFSLYSSGAKDANLVAKASSTPAPTNNF
jgi:hypothetical protein